MPTSSFSVPLPSSWPKHAKAATLHVISLANFALTQVRGWAANSPIHRVRLAAELDQLNSEVAMLREEIRIKDARMAALVPQRRPHYSPSERMAILQLMAARGWSKAQTGRRFLVTDDTVASWSGRIEEDGPGALVKATVPVNKFPDFVAAMVSQAQAALSRDGPAAHRRLPRSRGSSHRAVDRQAHAEPRARSRAAGASGTCQESRRVSGIGQAAYGDRQLPKSRLGN